MTLDEALRRVFEAFRAYPLPAKAFFCGQCHHVDEIEYYRETPLLQFDEAHSRNLLVESAEHWESTGVYKHYLPVILRRLTPPDHVDALYPAHPFETLAWRKFKEWPVTEQDAVRAFIAGFVDTLQARGDPDTEEWRSAAASIQA